MTTQDNSNEPKGRAAAINAMCKSCIYDPIAAGTWREQTAACVSGGCPLHPFRPMPRGIKTGNDLAKLRAALEKRGR